MSRRRQSDPELESGAPTIRDVHPQPVRGLEAPLERLSFHERYEREEVLGRGGMGEILLYHDKQIGRRIAAKVLRRDRGDRPENKLRFVREARLQGQLEHPSIVPVYDLDLDPGGRLYFTMKRIKGVTLERIIEHLAQDDPDTASKYSLRRLLSDFSSVCLAVDFAHQHGVVHRDLKPANVMLGDYGEVYVLDWGIARIPHTFDSSDEGQTPSSSPGSSDETRPGAVMGTHGYMAPEQTRGDGETLGPRSDVYALGSILFELLTLTKLHPQTTPTDVAASTLSGVDARPSVRTPERDVAPELEAICVRATALEPNERFGSAREMHEAIERFLDGQRDVERRRQLAAHHADKAQQAAGRALSDEQAGVSARREAMREVGRALALDPDNRGAMTTMVRLLGEPPRHDPPEVTAEIEGTRRQHIRWVGRLAAAAYATLVVYLPLFFWNGVRQGLAVLVFYALAAACSVLSLVTARARRPRVGMVLGVMVLSQLTFASTFPFFGPLVLMPTLLAVNTGAFALHLERRHRPWAFLTGAVAFLIPLGLEISGAVPRSYRFTQEGMLIVARALELPRVPTLAFLGLTGLAAIGTLSVAVSGIRDGLSRAERQIHTYAWHLREMVPRSSRPSR